ncbi:hypothetical protein [Tenacibaculum sp. 47A_GOM-205m]|uniref:hypothetical protein n=1 Tax=Tenacibaculum sp. 47A_GOM-205m TaxID=1380384 RepID=UPI00048CD5EC|nr:hypothetical protein [Tenacibaculum sp. 47A_GOM-205m]
MKYLILIIICVIIQSCGSDCTNVYFTENDKTWFNNYEAGNKLIFKSQLNDFDTIFITNKITKEPKGECNPFVSNFDKEFARIDYKIKKDTFNLVEDYFIQINANEKKKDASPVIRLLNLEFSSFNNILPKTKQSELKTEWKNVYTFNKNNCPYSNLNGKFGLTEFEWDKEFGLISYTNEKGEKWTLIKKE